VLAEETLGEAITGSSEEEEVEVVVVDPLLLEEVELELSLLEDFEFELLLLDELELESPTAVSLALLSGLHPCSPFPRA